MNLLTNREATVQNMLAIEGERWAKTQDDGNGFNVREALDKLASAQNSDRKPDDSVCVIYGRGGWNRYFVRVSGEVVFSRAHGLPQDTAKAETFGFQVV